jgi:HD-like signal output (HDOD) protein
MRKLVYIVDDEAAVVEAMVLLLESMDARWRVRGFTSPLAALAAVKSEAPDLVLADHEMLEMKGNELLEEVRAAAPQAVRIIISGCVDVQALSTVLSAHQYIAKPFEALQLKELIERTFAARARLEEQGLGALVTGLRSLPSLPHVYYLLLAELGNERRSVEAIAQLVAKDAGLSSKLLQLANSPMFGRGALVSGLLEAVMCLGTDMIKAVVLSQEVFRQYARVQSWEIDLPRLWTHCWQVAELAQGICLDQGLSQGQAEEAFLAGILHELGKLILIDNFPREFQAAWQAALRAHSPLTPVLLSSLHATPAQLAAYLLELWGLPKGVILAVAWHEGPENGGSKEFSPATALYIADQVATRKWPPDSLAVADWNAEYLKAVGCESDLSVWQRFGAAGS